MRAALVLVLLALPLAGCTVEAPTIERAPEAALPADAASRMLNDTANATFDAPQPLQRGQWWKVRLSGDGVDQVETRAVVGETGQHWLVGTDSPAEAYYEARYDISTIGRIRKADMAGEQQGAAVEMYRWPLLQNATWSTGWDGVQRQIRVLGNVSAIVGGKSYPAVALEGTDGAGVLGVRYNYVPAIGWFSSMEFPTQGGFRIDVLGSGVGYNGTVAEARATEVYRDGAGGRLQPQGSFNVPAGASYLDVQGSLQGDGGGYNISFRAPDNTLHYTGVGPCFQNCSLEYNTTLPGIPGEWRVLAVGMVQGSANPPQTSLTVVAAEVRTRAFS
jgi:hypothetical protein